MNEDTKHGANGKALKKWFSLCFGIAVMALLNPGTGMAGFQHVSESALVSSGQTEDPSAIDSTVGERIILVRRGNRSSDGSGEESNGGGNGNRKGGYGSGDGSGTGDRPQDGSGKGKGKGKGSGSGNCDGSGSKGKGSGNKTK